MLGLFCIAWAWILVTVAVLSWYHHQIPGFSVSSRTNIPVSPEAAAAAAAAAQVPRRKDAPKAPMMPPSSVGTYLEPFQSPLLVFTCRRAGYLRQTLDDIYNFRDSSCRIGCPLVVSQDGKDDGVTQVIEEYQEKFAAVDIPLIHLQHEAGHLRKQNAYQLLAVHYGWALRQVFGDQLEYDTQDGAHRQLNAQRVLILEEDIHIAVDFFSFFAAMAPLLDHDASLLAVSAFNDNGFPERVSDTTRVLRSDFFPGLGWMMTRKLWNDELASKWPPGYWDDWLREPDQRLGRHILRPEVSRTFHFGSKGGASSNLFGDKLSHIELDHDAVDWTQQDVAASLSEDKFDETYFSMVESALKVNNFREAGERIKDGNVRIEYQGIKHFSTLAQQLGLMKDEKAGIPRTAYKGVVETRLDGKHFLFMTPPMEDLKKSFAHATSSTT